MRKKWQVVFEGKQNDSKQTFSEESDMANKDETELNRV